MNLNRLFIGFFLVFNILVLSLYSQEASLALKGGNVIDVKTGNVLKNQTILIENGTITEMGKVRKKSIPQGTREIDVSDKWLIPGLIDAHVHFFQSGGLYTRPDILDIREIVPYEKEQEWLQEHWDQFLSSYIQNGVTTVVDVGGPLENFKIRDSLAKTMVAPEVSLTGPLISTYQPKAFEIEDPPIIKAHDPEEARKLVRKQLPYQPDFIKIWYIVTENEPAEANLPIIKAVIDESHQHDLKVAVHATELKTARLAVEAGADFLVHSVTDQEINESFLKLLKRNEVTYIPTLQVMNNYERTFAQKFDFSPHVFHTSEPHSLGSLFDLQHIDSTKRPEWLNKKLTGETKIFGKADSIMATNLKKVNAYGINVVTGTDAGNIGTMHGASYYRELELMKKAGLSNLDVLQASTINGNDLLDAISQPASIAKGNAADMLVLDGNPLDSLHHVKSIHRVIKSGEVINPDSLIFDSPEALAQKQLNAYNAKNLEAFLRCYSEDVKVYNFSDHLQYKGMDNMKEVYEGFFNQAPEVHCELVNRINMGNYVIDRERITGLPNGDIMNATAIYKVEEGKIQKVWFMK